MNFLEFKNIMKKKYFQFFYIFILWLKILEFLNLCDPRKGLKLFERRLIHVQSLSWVKITNVGEKNLLNRLEFFFLQEKWSDFQMWVF